MYNVTCVNNDLTIPRLYYNNATALYDPNGEIVRRPYNNYLQQATQIDQYGRPYYTAADFAADTAFMTVTPDSILFTLTYANQGSNAIKDPYQITIYKDYLHGQVVRTFTLRDTLLRSQRTTRTIAIPRSSVCKATHLQYIIALNDAGHGIAQNDGLISECDTTNNTYNFTFDSPEPPSSTDSITQCDSYLWGQNSRNYYNSGIYHDTVPCRRTALAGCDSIISLYLTIHHSSMEATDTTACDQYVWHVNGRTYTENTTLTLTFTNQQGCDSICKLNVTIYPTTYQEVFEHGCNTFYWPVDRRTYDRSVVHAEHMMSQHGCDSTYTLVLRMHYTHYDTIYDTICEGDTRAFFGQQISMEGTYMYNGSTLEGCDSISTLKIVVKPQIIPDFDSMSNCETREFSLKMHPQDSNIYQQWYMYPDDGSLRGHTTDSIISFQPTLTTVYRLTARYREGLRCDATKSISVTPIQPVVAGISASSECFTPTINEIRLSSTSTGADTYAWFINGQFYSLMPTFNVEAPDNSTDSLRITLIALNNHCSDTAKTVLWSLGEGLHAPNIFTPGAERNTRFRVYGQNIIDYEIFIYNRKGVLVYHSQMLDEGWDGTAAGGTKCPQGSYAYYIRYRTQVVPDATKTKVGTVLLVR
ncbi:MAG: gliding motility-associated C-terminal domain-containing protein, partial [Bacteroidales bacterium]|nr:gliding motility-associated C-terminal domain-containing protein [Candidatus Colimorpha onthohippi]